MKESPAAMIFILRTAFAQVTHKLAYYPNLWYVTMYGDVNSSLLTPHLNRSSLKPLLT